MTVSQHLRITSIILAVSATLLSGPSHAQTQDKFTDADFSWDNKTRPYRKLIVAGVNKVYRENAKCKQIDPSSAYISGSRSTPSNPTFYVLCGEGHDVFQAYFSKADIERGNVLAAKNHIDRSTAIDKCEEYARNKVMHPSTFKFKRGLGVTVTNHANANTTIQSTFTTKNSYNLEIKYNIRCLMNAEGLLEGTITEARN